MSLRRLSALTFTLSLVACAIQTPTPVIKPQPVRQPVATPPAPTIDWRDLPVRSGNWSYAGDADGSSARFGATPDFLLRCLKGSRQITLSAKDAGTATALTIRTSYGARTLPAVAGVATLAASDPLLDQIAFSRGRFTVEAAGISILVMPAWAEPARVIEDCRL